MKNYHKHLKWFLEKVTREISRCSKSKLYLIREVTMMIKIQKDQFRWEVQRTEKSIKEECQADNVIVLFLMIFLFPSRDKLPAQLYSKSVRTELLDVNVCVSRHDELSQSLSCSWALQYPPAGVSRPYVQSPNLTHVTHVTHVTHETESVITLELLPMMGDPSWL